MSPADTIKAAWEQTGLVEVVDHQSQDDAVHLTCRVQPDDVERFVNGPARKFLYRVHARQDLDAYVGKEYFLDDVTGDLRFSWTISIAAENLTAVAEMVKEWITTEVTEASRDTLRVREGVDDPHLLSVGNRVKAAWEALQTFSVKEMFVRPLDWGGRLSGEVSLRGRLSTKNSVAFLRGPATAVLKAAQASDPGEDGVLHVFIGTECVVRDGDLKFAWRLSLMAQELDVGATCLTTWLTPFYRKRTVTSVPLSWAGPPLGTLGTSRGVRPVGGQAY